MPSGQSKHPDRSGTLDRRLTLETEVKYVPGVGPLRAQWFADLGVRTVADLVEHYPFRHEYKPKSKPIGMLVLDEVATIVGELRRVRMAGVGRSRRIEATVIDGTGQCRVTWFNCPYLENELRGGQIIRLTGHVGAFDHRACFTNPEWSLIDSTQKDLLASDQERFEPVYPAKTELPSRQIRRIVDTALAQVSDLLKETLPEALRKKRNLPSRRTAILRLHQPTREGDIPIARRRLAYEELLLLQLAVQMSRRRSTMQRLARPITVNEAVDARIRRRLPFALTKGQERAVREICADLGSGVVMNRLLQADVGAGKTVVAVYAALAAVANQDQVVMAAPTEILARQHFAKVQGYLRGSRVRLALLVGSAPKVQRRTILRGLAQGEIDFCIGTHALLEPEVKFARLNLVIVDEQHKFGVAQRAKLRGKGGAPHLLVLTATPIPRTLAMTVFGDLDVSTIVGLPPGRQPVVTRLVTRELTQRAWDFVRKRLAQGDQAYVVYPLVEASAEMPLKSAREEAQRLAKGELAGFNVGLLHGRMSAEDKQRAMGEFARGRVQALVATTVIEVGVDVPNAALMIVQHADRYGLSQLHQLRGRVGRGSRKSYCLLFAEEVSKAALDRLRILTEVSDGFRIAEEDLKIRGPGELLGTRQHGMPVFKVADLIRDFDLIENARDDAAELLGSDSGLQAAGHELLRRAAEKKYGPWLGFIESG